MNDIEMAQVEAGENAVVERLRRKGLLPPEVKEDCYCVCHSPLSSCPACKHCKGDNEVVRRYQDKQRQQLEHSLATGFIELQSEQRPVRRQEIWSELLRLAAEIKKLNNG